MSEDQTRLMMEMKGDIAGIKAILSTMANTNEVAIKALESASSAHHRISDLAEDIKSLEKNQNWLPKLIATNVITAGLVGFISFAISKI